jgi:hypothetical protein
MTILRNIICSVCLTGALALVTGCTSTTGGIVPKSAFVYPNSNVTPLGPVTAEKSKTRFFVTPRLNYDWVEDVYNQALGKAPGANIIVDYREDTTVTSILLFNTVTYSLNGTAAKMDVGKKVMK